MTETPSAAVVPTVSSSVLKELTDLFLGLSYVLQSQAKQVAENQELRASFYFQPLGLTYSWMDDAIRSPRCESCLLATAILKLLVKKSSEIPDPKDYFLKTLSLETSRLLSESSFEELDRVVALILPDLLKLYEPVKGAQAPDGLKIIKRYDFRAQSCLGGKARWFRGVARIIYRYYLGRINRNTTDRFGIVQIWG